MSICLVLWSTPHQPPQVYPTQKDTVGVDTHSGNEALRPLAVIQCVGWNGAHLQKEGVS